jgi:hypothetical protein
MPFAHEFPPARSSTQIEAVRRMLSRYRGAGGPSRRPSAPPSTAPSASAPKTPAPSASDVVNLTAAR